MCIHTLRHSYATHLLEMGLDIGSIIRRFLPDLLKVRGLTNNIIPAGGMDKNGQWKTTKQNGEFLFDVKQMSNKFSAIFAKKLRKLKQQGKINKFVPRKLIPEPWVVYAKQAFGSPHSVVEYLGRYSHRVAISNARILKVTDTHVTFKWCNRKDNYKSETKTFMSSGT